MPELAAQLVLGIRLHEDAKFENFLPGQNGQLTAHLQQFLQNEDEHFFYIGGLEGSGKSHLLQACCHWVTARQQTAVYVPLKSYRELSVRLLEDLECVNLICVDDIQCVAEDKLWQEALFHLYNRSKAVQSKLIVSGCLPPREIKLSLPDLVSRLCWGQVYQLHPLLDEDKIAALQTRAKAQGFALPLEVARFLLRRCSREMPALFAILEQLDRASLSAQRRLTIPFVKQVLRF